MKIKTLLSVLFTVVSFISIEAQERTRLNIYKSGYIEYKVTGYMQGTSKVWWDDFGEKYRTETNTFTVHKSKGKIDTLRDHNISITVKDTIWDTDLIENTGTKQIDDLIDPMVQEMAEGKTHEEMMEYAKKIVENFGGKYIGKENILEYECQIMKHPVCMAWFTDEGVLLQWKTRNVLVKHKETAVEFIRDFENLPSWFEPFEDIEYEPLKSVKEEFNDSFKEIGSMFKEMYENAD